MDAPDLLLEKVRELLRAHYGLPGSSLQGRPYLFSPVRVHLPIAVAEKIGDIVCGIESVIRSPYFQKRRFDTGQSLHSRLLRGVLFGYDFHISDNTPYLIEINTNAGGAFLVALLEAVQANNLGKLANWEITVAQMFREEWQLLGVAKPLDSVAIVDFAPEAQYFYPEFLLFQGCLNRQGIKTHILDPHQLRFAQEKLWTDDVPLDLIYNRLTDFDLTQPACLPLKTAFLSRAKTGITPHPVAYLRYANKHNLCFLSDPDFLGSCAVSDKIRRCLQKHIPHTQRVRAQIADQLWDRRKHLFFKPCKQYGGKGVYRGKNLTRKTFARILQDDYIAQTLVPPPEIQVGKARCKVDIRAYVYNGQVLNFAARLYQGQVTNFRRPYSGFAYCQVG